jgi:hypothetical protein
VKQRLAHTLWAEILLATQEWTLVVLGMAAMLDGVRVTKAVGVAMLARGAVEVEMVAERGAGEAEAEMVEAAKPMVV